MNYERTLDLGTFEDRIIFSFSRHKCISSRFFYRTKTQPEMSTMKRRINWHLAIFVLSKLALRAAAFTYISSHNVVSLNLRDGFSRSAATHSSQTTALNVECKDGTMKVSRTFVPSPAAGEEGSNISLSREAITREFTLSYKIFRPMTLSSQKGCPIVALHGGPSVPSDYLFPLVDVVPYRSIVFYDQLGCGRSDSPEDVDAYSIEKGVDDLEALVSRLGLKSFHLFGQSFGGILGYEFLKRISERHGTDPAFVVLSFCMSSTPTNVLQVEQEAQVLLEKLLEEDGDISTVESRFQSTHICRTPEKPQALLDAYSHAGTVWRGSAVIADYVAQPPLSNAAPLPPAMIMRGEHDFATEGCIKDWKQKIWNHNRIREKMLEGCSHHGLHEDGPLYGEIVDSFCKEYDP